MDPQGHWLLDLTQLPQGSRAIVRCVAGGREMLCRLSALGVSNGVPIEVLVNRGRGPLVVLVHGTRIALGRGEASRIRVEAGERIPP
jgi:Fe2+ transport system protein FeoA